jgi:hypothetical protein
VIELRSSPLRSGQAFDASGPEGNPQSGITASLAIAGRSMSRLIRIQHADGSFLYEYDCTRPEVCGRYNVTRHAGCAYALAYACASTQFQSLDGLESAARRAIEYLIRRLQRFGTGRYVTECDRPSATLGATALLSCALSFEPFRSEYTDLYGCLRGALSSAVRDNGSFVCRFNAPVSESEHGQDYYPGEALLAIARYCELGLENAALRAVIRPAFEFYRWRFQSAPHTGMVLWHTDACTRLHSLARTRPELGAARAADYLDFSLQLVEWMLKRQRPLAAGGKDEQAGGLCMGVEPGIGTASFVEALLKVSRTLTREGRAAHAAVYDPHIEAALGFIRRLHYSADHCSDDSWYWVHGGTPISHTRQRFRMDSDQHVITMCLAALERG